MLDRPPAETEDPVGRQALALTVGCRFGLETSQHAETILQVAPSPGPGIAIRSERWET